MWEIGESGEAYVYAHGNPVSHVDPWGTQRTSKTNGGGATKSFGGAPAGPGGTGGSSIVAVKPKPGQQVKPRPVGKVVQNCSTIGKSVTRLPNSQMNPPKIRGDAPTNKADGTPIEIHHVGQNPNGPFKEMTQQNHRGPGKHAENHPNRGPSQINRNVSRNERRDYWKQEWDRGRWGNNP